jgi:hypothetical protein
MNAAVAALATAVLLGVTSTPPARTLVAGPALVGDRVVWGEVRGQTSVLVAAGDRAPFWQSDASWLAGPLAGSSSTISFATSSTPCSGANTACPVETTIFAGRRDTGFVPITRPLRCASATAGRTIAVSASLVATVTPSCESATSTVTVHEGRREVFRRDGVDCCQVALAGQTLAWSSGGAVSVFDLATRRLRYRVAPPAGEPITAFDVQADGKLAMLVGRQPDGHSTAAWRSATAPTLHRLSLSAVLPARPPSLRLTDDRLVLETAPPASATDSPRGAMLVVSDLAGHQRVLARFSSRLEQVGGFDATSRAVTWASRSVTRTRLDCPPPGQQRPCLLRKTGVLTIWQARLQGGRAHPVASWSFTDAP